MSTLDLTCASQAFVMEPHPLIEEQAINRILCIGQTTEVSINRYVMGRSIEETMVHTRDKENLSKPKLSKSRLTNLERLRSLLE